MTGDSNMTGYKRGILNTMIVHEQALGEVYHFASLIDGLCNTLIDQ